MNVNIFPASKSDLNEIAMLENDLFGKHAYPQFFIRQAYDCWKENLLVAKQNEGKIVGYVLLTMSNQVQHYWIMSLAVSPQYRGRGIAKSLVIEVMSHLVKGSNIRLTVDPRNHSALSLYQSLGFTTLGEETDYFGGNESRLVMEFVKKA